MRRLVSPFPASPPLIRTQLTEASLRAGVPSIYQSTCQGSCDVSGPGSPAYDNAYFAINYVRAYTTGGPATQTQTSTASSADPTSTVTVSSTVSADGSTRTGGASGDTSGVTPVGGASATIAALVCALLGLLLL